MLPYILLPSRCWWWARFLRCSWFDAAKISLGILAFCNRILSVLVTEPPHCRGSSDYLLIWTCADMIFSPTWPVTTVVNSGVIGIFNFILCSTVGKNDVHRAPLSMLSHCLCHFVIPSFFSSVAIVVIGIQLYSTFSSPLSSPRYYSTKAWLKTKHGKSL